MTSLIAFEVLEKLEKTNSKLEKAEILRKNLYAHGLGDIFSAVFDYNRRFYMKKWETNDLSSVLAEKTAVERMISETPDSDVLDKGSLQARLQKLDGILNKHSTHAEFMELLHKLENRIITGNAALHETEKFFQNCMPDQTKWYSRVLQQDLKIGVSIDTVIKCGFYIPKFEVQLATDGHKCKKLDQMLSAGCLASPKFDGYRCVAVINRGDVHLYSRNGNEYENFPIIKQALIEAYPNTQVVLDGEIMSDDFNAMQQTAFASKRNTTVGDVVYHVFDVIPYDEWITCCFNKPHQARINTLSSTLKPLASFKCIKQVEHHPVNSLEEIKSLEQSFIAQGYEGVMVNPDIRYTRGKKANSMLKFKTMVSMDCKVIGYYPGERGTKYEKTLGGLVVMQENGVDCKVGSGFPDDERNDIFKDPNAVLGRTLEIKYQELTADKRMRFPVKFRWRTDKDLKSD